MQTLFIVIGVIILLFLIIVLRARKPLKYHNMGILKYNGGDFKGAIADQIALLEIHITHAVCEPAIAYRVVVLSSDCM